MSRHYAAVAQRAGHRCEYCHAPEAIFNFAFEVEHIIPRSRGGADDETNHALACRSCNLYKSDHVLGMDETTQSEVRLYNPRLDTWAEHFEADAKTGELRPLTSIGRVTVALLQLNGVSQLEARRHWMRLGLFP